MQKPAVIRVVCSVPKHTSVRKWLVMCMRLYAQSRIKTQTRATLLLYFEQKKRDGRGTPVVPDGGKHETDRNHLS